MVLKYLMIKEETSEGFDLYYIYWWETNWKGMRAMELGEGRPNCDVWEDKGQYWNKCIINPLALGANEVDWGLIVW